MRSDIDSQTRALIERLRDLPVEARPPYDWAEFKRRATRRRSAQGTFGWRYAAAAAGFTLLIVAAALVSRFGADEQVQAVAQFGPVSVETHEPRFARRRADALQLWLESLPAEPAIVHVGTRLAVVDLEDQIAWVDDLLTAQQVEGAQPDHVAALQRQRAWLVDSLARVRHAENLAAGLP